MLPCSATLLVICTVQRLVWENRWFLRCIQKLWNLLGWIWPKSQTAMHERFSSPEKCISTQFLGEWQSRYNSMRLKFLKYPVNYFSFWMLFRYYFDHATSTCQLFWYGTFLKTGHFTSNKFRYDGCQSEVSRNIFPNLLECQWLCEKHPPNKASKEVLNYIFCVIICLIDACLEPFDQHYRDECKSDQNF